MGPETHLNSAFHDRHNRPRTGNLLQVGSRRIRTICWSVVSPGVWTRKIQDAPQQVIILPMYISAYLNGSFQLEQDRLVDEDLSRFGAEVFNFVLLELNGFSWAVSAYCFKRVAGRWGDSLDGWSEKCVG